MTMVPRGFVTAGLALRYASTTAFSTIQQLQTPLNSSHFECPCPTKSVIDALQVRKLVQSALQSLRAKSLKSLKSLLLLSHLDTHTIPELMKRKRPTQIVAPLGNVPYFRSLGIKDELLHTLDWWEGRRVEINVKTEFNDVQVKADAESASSTGTKLAFDVTCTPAQHFTGRGLFDRFQTLWASWVLQEVVPAESANTTTGAYVYFAGDTGYRAFREGRGEEAAPTCPAFKEIGERFGGFDFAMIPIGAYRPRDFMSPIHCSPHDSVAVFKDIRAKKALGMHWGTWVLASEDVLEPPVLLAAQCKKADIANEDFVVCDIGDTRVY